MEKKLENLPCYMVLADDEIIIFKRGIPKHIFKIEKKNIKDFGLIDKSKWTCWSNKGKKSEPNAESTWLIRRFLSV